MKDKYKKFIEKNKKDMYVFIGMLIFSIILCTNFLKIHFANNLKEHFFLLHQV